MNSEFAALLALSIGIVRRPRHRDAVPLPQGAAQVAPEAGGQERPPAAEDGIDGQAAGKGVFLF